jgi:signal transduction histidine kinase
MVEPRKPLDEDDRRTRILIVDDEDANLQALRVTLGGQGFDVAGFTHPDDALEAITPGAFDVLLTDLMMPSTTGVELLQRAHERDPHLSGVIMTGEGSIASAVESMRSGAVDYVLKPLKLSNLLPILASARTLGRLRRENDQLEQSVRARTAELEHALEEVDRQAAERLKAEQALMQAQKIEAIGRLTGGVAHDFNNLLAAVIGNLELLQRKLPSEAEPCRRFVDNALEAASRGAKVTGQLLAFSRTQRLRLEPQEVDATLRRSDPLLRQALGPGVDLEVSLKAEGAWASTDATQLELAALNLIVNAREALPDGGVVRLSTHLEPDRIILEVADTGVGMTSEVLARATEPFFTTRTGSGTGLGLAQVHGFARQCGGDCEIDSAPGEGTRVRVWLPRTEPPALRVEAPPEPVATQRDGLRVLVVDDDRHVRDSLCEALASEGFLVRWASDGPSGLAQLEMETPDAVVLDYAMPGMTGAEVARRAQASHPHLPIVFLSGYADSLALDQIEAAAVLRKPISIADLSRALRLAVG